MVPRLLVLALGKVVGFPSRMKLWQFAAACRKPREVQAALLREILAMHADTDFGREHGFATIRTVADFRRQVPIRGYEAIEPYVARVRRGETRALLADDRVLMFALTSGTTAARKTIPITPRYLADYRRGWNRWGLRALLDHQRISCSPILQVAGDPEEYTTEAGIPCGSLSGLTVRMQKRIIRFLYTFPAAASGIRDHETKQYVALRLAIGRPVGMIVAPNPSTLAALARVLNERKEGLLRDLRDGTLAADLPIADDIRAALTPRLKQHQRRARALDRIAEKTGALWPRDVWPADRMLLGTWTGGSVGPYLRQLTESYGETSVRDLGLLASEGRMTIPLADDSKSGVLDVTTHFFEFIPESEIESPRPTVVEAQEVKEGGDYYLVPTTAAGLYRYDLRDLVRVTGFHGRTPLLEFLGKGGQFASVTGEKLTEHQVTRAVAEEIARRGIRMPAYSLAPCWDERQPYYGLFVERGAWNEGSNRDLASAIDGNLGRANDEYRGKRASGRLGSVQIIWLRPGTWADWDRQRLAKTGGSVDQFKHPCLIGDLGFAREISAKVDPAPC